MIHWLQLPLWLMQLHLTPAACIVYALIANRHRLSIATNAQSGTWADDQGIYCIYPRAELAAAAGLSVTTISRAMRELVAAGLIIDRRLGQGLPNHLYIVDQATTGALDPVPDIQHADQLSIDDLMSDYPDTTTPAAVQAAPDLRDQDTPAAEQDTPAAEQDTPAAEQDTPAAEQDTPAAEQDTPAAEQDTPAAEQDTPASIEGTVIPESKELRFPYIKENNLKKYVDRSSRHTSDILSAVRRCLSYAYGIDPDTVSHDQYNTAAERCSRALDVRNPVTYTAAIIAQLYAVKICTPQTQICSTLSATEWENEWLDAVRAYDAQKSVV